MLALVTQTSVYHWSIEGKHSVSFIFLRYCFLFHHLIVDDSVFLQVIRSL
jgi:hypothetical protein